VIQIASPKARKKNVPPKPPSRGKMMRKAPGLNRPFQLRNDRQRLPRRGRQHNLSDAPETKYPLVTGTYNLPAVDGAKRWSNGSARSQEANKAARGRPHTVTSHAMDVFCWRRLLEAKLARLTQAIFQSFDVPSLTSFHLPRRPPPDCTLHQTPRTAILRVRWASDDSRLSCSRG
jgi:hypothetical protein